MNRSNKKPLLTLVALVIIFGVGFFIWNSFKNSGDSGMADPKLLMNANSHVLEEGTRIYPVTLVEFGDYQCPACGFAEALVEKITDEDPKIRRVFRNFPLTTVHKHALQAAEAAEAANAQGKFWEMLKLLYTNQDTWSKQDDPLPFFSKMAEELQLDVHQFTSDVSANKYADVINKDRADGTALGVNSTPTFYINGKKYTGPNNYAALKSAIDEATP